MVELTEIAQIASIGKDTSIEDLESLTEEEKDALVFAEALETVDLDLPHDYEIEILAADLLDNISAYRKSEIARRAARQQGDHPTAEKLSKQAATCRSAAALIQHEYPDTKALYKELANIRVLQFRKNRSSFLEES
jgi:hypothetical protein